MEEVIGLIPIRSANQPSISDIRIVNGNLKPGFDHFHGIPLWFSAVKC